MVFPVVGGTQDTSYEIENSLRPGGGDNHHLSMVYSSAASDANRRKFTFSGWIKLGQADHYSTSYDNDRYLLSSTDASASTTSIGYGYTAADFHLYDGRSGTYIYTTSKFRDPSAWYHLVVKYDSTQSTASDRIFIYVNGESQPLAYSNSGDPEVDLNTAVDFFSAGDDVDATSADSGNFVHNVNGYMNSGFGAAAGGFDGYFADWYLLDGQALAPTEFAKTDANGFWVPKKYTGTFNSHSFHLEFKQTGSSANSSGIGADTSGQDNHFKVGVNSTLAAIDVTTDTPTNNFATFNPIDVGTNLANCTFSEGNCKVVKSGTTSSNGDQVVGSMAFTQGKWYWEIKGVSNNENLFIGVFNDVLGGIKPYHNNYFYGIYGDGNGNNSQIYASQESDIRGYGIDNGTCFSNNDIIQIAFDADNFRLYVGRNGSWTVDNASGSGTITSGSGFNESTPTGYYQIPSGAAQGGFWRAGITVAGSSVNFTSEINFGNPPFSISSGNSDANGYGNFEYAVPSNYYSLCTKNLAEYG